MQTLASVAPISALLEALEVGEPLSHGALTVIPLLAPKEADPDWFTLAEAGAGLTITQIIARGEGPAPSPLNDPHPPVPPPDGAEVNCALPNPIPNTPPLRAPHPTPP